MKKLILALVLFLSGSPSYGQFMSEVRVGMKDSLYQVLLTRDPFSDVRLPTDSVVYTNITGYGTKVAFDGWIRYKGNSTRYFDKKGHQIKFDSNFPSPSMPGKTFRTLTLNPMFTDKSFVREAFVWKSLHDLGTMAPQTSYAQFYINNDYKGLYLQIDKVDKYLINNWGRNNKCQMFEAEDYYCEGDFDIESDSLLRLHYLPELTPATDAQYNRLKSMIYEMNTVSDADFVAWFDQTWDTKSVMDWFAINTLSTSGDSYNKNYFIYNDTTRSTQQWTIIPWDYDLSMGRNGDVTVPYPWGILSDLFVYTYNPLAGPHNVLKDRFMQSPILMERFRVYMDSLFTNVWTEQKLHARIDSLATIVAPYVYQESVPQEWGQGVAFEEHIEALKYYITVRRNCIISTFTRPIGGQYNMAYARKPFVNGVWNHAVSIDGRQVASVRLISRSTPLDSIFFRVRTDSLPPGQFDTTRPYIKRWLEVRPYPSTAVFNADIQWSWKEYNQEDSEVRGDERYVVPHYWLAESELYGYFPVEVGQVNAYGNFVTMENVNETMVGINRHFAVLMPGVTSVTDAKVVASYELGQNYPNPFNPATTISFDLPRSSSVRLTVFDVMGREVAVLVDNTLSAGTHSVSFNATNLASGTYIYRLSAGEFVQTRKMVVVK